MTTCCLATGLASLWGPGASSAQGQPPPLVIAHKPAQPPISTATSGSDISIWYRSTEGCPDGEAFIGRLRALGRGSALASVGDRVDFVVSLAQQSEASSGRLERQTERGTVAIRELKSQSCDDVAEALALSLELTLRPGRDPSHTGSFDAGTAAEPRGTPPEVAANPAAGALPKIQDRVSDPEGKHARESSSFRFGAQGTATTGVLPEIAPGAAAFVELGAGGSELAARLSVHGTYGVSHVRGIRLSAFVVAARLDGCALGWDTQSVSVQPCLGFDVGLLSANASGQAASADRGPWVSALGLLRGRLRLWPSVSPEIQIGASVPLLRYAMGTTTGNDLFRTEAVGFEAALGVHWSP